MKYLNQPLTRTVLISGAAIGALAAILSDKHPTAWLMLMGAWVIVAGLSAYPIIKAGRKQ